MDADEIRTERLLLRRWRDADREPFARLNADPEVMRYFPAPLTRTESDAAVDRFEARFVAQGFGLWALEVLATGTFIGFTGLNPMPAGSPGEGGFEVGWRLARDAWGHGFATEAGRVALAVAFGPAELDEVWSITAVMNTPSVAVMERLGLVRHSTFEHPALPEASPLRPHVAYRIDPTRWERLSGTRASPRARSRGRSATG